jgi:hypothetical protein
VFTDRFFPDSGHKKSKIAPKPVAQRRSPDGGFRADSSAAVGKSKRENILIRALRRQTFMSILSHQSRDDIRCTF